MDCYCRGFMQLGKCHPGRELMVCAAAKVSLALLRWALPIFPPCRLLWSIEAAEPLPARGHCSLQINNHGLLL